MGTDEIEEEVEGLINGNISNFKRWLKKCSKEDMLTAIFIYHYKTAIDYYGYD